MRQVPNFAAVLQRNGVNSTSRRFQSLTAGKLPEDAFFPILVLRQDPRPHHRDGGDGRSGRGRSLKPPEKP